MGVIFDGQSLNLAPSGPTRMPDVTMAGLGVQHHVIAASGQSWSTLALWQEARTAPFAALYDRAVLVLTGGTSDIWAGGDNDTAAVALANMEDYATAARALGVDRIVATTIPPSTIFDADDEAQRLALNAAILTSSAWEAVADVAAVPELADPLNATYYVDQLHWTSAGSAAAAGVIRPAVVGQIG